MNIELERICKEANVICFEVLPFTGVTEENQSGKLVSEVRFEFRISYI
jgi:hypothetical protein